MAETCLKTPEVFVELNPSKLTNRQLQDEIDGVAKYIEALKDGLTLREGREQDALLRAQQLLEAIEAEVEKRKAKAT